MTLTGFHLWMRQSRRGEACVYHTGLLMADRTWMNEIEALARAVLEAASQRKIILTQRRVSDGQCDYIATRV